MSRVIRAPEELRDFCDVLRVRQERIGLVPTMGALHEGHLSLIDQAREHGATKVLVTIFVNPLQFGPSEDYTRYPRSLEQDIALCESKRVDAIFAPETDALIPSSHATFVEVTGALTSVLEAVHRPTHFRGVTTIVAKLFSLVGPCTALFGRKDYQQWKIIETMTRELQLPVTIVGCPIVREPDGLALSSRNRYLSAEARKRALRLPQGLLRAQRAYQEGQRVRKELLRIACAEIEQGADAIDYVELVDPNTLQTSPDKLVEAALLCAAVRVDTTRLIDNLLLTSAG